MSVPAAIANALANAIGRDEVDLLSPQRGSGSCSNGEAGAVRLRAARDAR